MKMKTNEWTNSNNNKKQNEMKEILIYIKTTEWACIIHSLLCSIHRTLGPGCMCVCVCVGSAYNSNPKYSPIRYILNLICSKICCFIFCTSLIWLYGWALPFIVTLLALFPMFYDFSPFSGTSTEREKEREREKNMRNANTSARTHFSRILSSATKPFQQNMELKWWRGYSKSYAPIFESSNICANALIPSYYGYSKVEYSLHTESCWYN